MRLSRRQVLVGAGAALTAAAVPAWLLSRRHEGIPETGRPEHVILIDWDAFDPDYLARAPTPAIDALIRRGSLSTAQSTYTTKSNPVRASMSTGAYPEVHGNAAYYFDEESNRAVGQTRFLAAETITQALAAAGRTTAAVAWYMVQDHGDSSGDPRHLYVDPGGLFERRADAAIDILNLRPVDSGGKMVAAQKIPDFLAVYGADLDAFGHAEGAESPNLGPLVAELDRQLGRLVQATREVGIYERTTFVLTGDHGMTTWYRSLTEKLGALTILGRHPEILPAGEHASPDAEVVIVTAGRVADVTLRGPAATLRGRKEARAVFEGMEEISRVLDASDFEAFHASDKLGDFVLEATPPWGFGPPGSDKGSPRGGHGSTREIRVPLLISGAGVKVGGVARHPGLVDVAPTIAALLGVRSPADAQGRALSELLHVSAGR